MVCLVSRLCVYCTNLLLDPTGRSFSSAKFSRQIASTAEFAGQIDVIALQIAPYASYPGSVDPVLSIPNPGEDG